MPPKNREGIEMFYIEVPLALAAAFREMAEANRRTLRAEMILAMEAHYRAVTGKEPPPIPPGKKRGRPVQAAAKKRTRKEKT